MGICGEKFMAFICSNEIPHMQTNKILLTVLAVIFCFSLNAQTISPVKWDYSIKKINKAEAMVCLHAKIDKGWRIYSQNVGDDGPIKTEFRFKSSIDYELKGKTIEPEPITKHSEAFDMNISYFETEVTFMQKVKVKKYGTKITGYIKYMVENENMSVPPDDVRFSITL
jgi:hypothetical protein